MRNPTFFLVLLWSLWLTACSGNSTSSNVGGTPAAPTTAQETLSVEAPQAAQPSADVLVRHLLARAIPGPITQLRFTARDAQGKVHFSTALLPRQAEIVLSPVPIEATDLLIEYLDSQGRLLGVFQAQLTLVEGQTFLVEDPGFQDVVAAVTGLQLTPENTQIARGTFQQLTALATLQDGTRLNVNGQVVWTSTADATATVSSTGLATGLTPGSVQVTGRLGALTDVVNLTVTQATLEQVQVSPPTANAAAGTSQQFTALGQFSDGTFQDLSPFATWSANGAATVSATGLATGTTPGSAQIQAAFGGLQNAANLTVSDAVVVSIDVLPDGITLTPGAVQAFTATGNLSDGSTQNLTGSVVWTSNGNLAGNLLTASATGSFTVTATLAAINRSVPVTVSQPATTGPVLFTVHDRTMFRLLAFTTSPQTGVLAPIAAGYPLDSAGFPGQAGSLSRLVPNPITRTAFVLNRLNSNNSTAGARLVLTADGSATNTQFFTIIGPTPNLARWSPDGRQLLVATQPNNLGMITYGLDGAFLGSSLPQTLGAPVTGLTMSPTGRFAYACTAGNLFHVPINAPNNLGAPVATAQTGLSWLEAGPQARVLYAASQSAGQIRIFNLNLVTGAPTLASTVPLAGVRRLLVSPDQKFLFALTNTPDQVVVYPINQANLSLGAAVGTFAAGNAPGAMAVDPTSSFLYLASSGDNTVVAYAINRTSGQLTPVGGSPFATGETALSDLMVLP